MNRTIQHSFYALASVLLLSGTVSAQDARPGQRATQTVSSLTADDGIAMVKEAYKRFDCRLNRRPEVAAAFEREVRKVFKERTGVEVTEGSDVFPVYDQLMNVAAQRMSREGTIRFTANAVVLVDCFER
jgi:hypothetical protein